MYYLIVVIIMIVFGIYQFWFRAEDIFWNEVILIVVAAFIGFVICATTSKVTHEQYSVKTDLYAINDSIGNNYKMSGSTFLVIGGVSGDSYNSYNVNYAYKDTNGIIRPQQEKFDYKNDKFGYLEDGLNYYERIYEAAYITNSDFAIWFFNVSAEKDKVKDSEKTIDNIFHVPVNSVEKSSDIDLK